MNIHKNNFFLQKIIVKTAFMESPYENWTPLPFLSDVTLMLHFCHDALKVQSQNNDTLTSAK